MSPHEAHRSFWLIGLFSPCAIFSRRSQYEHLCSCRVQQHFIAANAGAEGPLGVEKSFFFKLLFTGHSFKVSFRNVFLLVVKSTLFAVALGHRRLQGPFWFLARLGFFNLPHDAVPWRF